MRVEAPIKVDRKTKKLAKRLSAGGKELLHTHSIDAVADKWLEYLSEVAQG